MSIDWQVYSRLEKQVVATVHTSGSADLPDPQPGGIPIMLIRAFTETRGNGSRPIRRCARCWRGRRGEDPSW